MRVSVRLVGTLVAVLVVATIGWAGYRWLQAWHQPGAGAADSVSYWLEPGVPDAAVKRAITLTGAVPEVISDRRKADLVITRSPSDDTSEILSNSIGAPVTPLSGAEFVKPEPTSGYFAAPGVQVGNTGLIQRVIARLTKPAVASGPEWTMDVVGDIGLGRSIYTGMVAHHDFDYPFEAFQGELKSADLAVANLECALSDQHAVVTDSGMTFVAPVKAAQGLKDAGIDAVSVANNHSYNGGPGGFTDTLAALNDLGVKPFGGGNNAAEAHKARIINVKGVRVGLLGYSAIVGSNPAGAGTPGMAFISMAPWGPLNETDVTHMEQDIRAAKKQADVVIPYFHWGTEYTHDANADQRSVAHRAIEAGADVVLGSHPHWTQGVEWYNGRLIAYSLGNFIFDQAWGDETKRSAILKMTFSGKRLQSAEFLPYDIVDNSKPQPAAADSAVKTLNDIFSHSWWVKP
jgi:poly-gamma-glutamate synthesis protein (capsule biosynthesis protein)